MPIDVETILEFFQLIAGVLGGDNSVLSTDGSLAGDETAGEIGGSLVGSITGSLGFGEDDFPTDTWGIISSVGGEVIP